jgi:hypothetical protein
MGAQQQRPAGDAMTAPTPEHIAATRAELAAAEIGRAAYVLRSLGWTVTPPVDPAAAIPEPAVGQVWRVPAGATGTWSREIVDFVPGRKSGHFVCRRILADGARGKRLLTTSASLVAWARKSGARPTTTTGAA